MKCHVWPVHFPLNICWSTCPPQHRSPRSQRLPRRRIVLNSPSSIVSLTDTCKISIRWALTSQNGKPKNSWTWSLISIFFCTCPKWICCRWQMFSVNWLKRSKPGMWRKRSSVNNMKHGEHWKHWLRPALLLRCNNIRLPSLKWLILTRNFFITFSVTMVLRRLVVHQQPNQAVGLVRIAHSSTMICIRVKCVAYPDLVERDY